MKFFFFFGILSLVGWGGRGKGEALGWILWGGVGVLGKGRACGQKKKKNVAKKG